MIEYIAFFRARDYYHTCYCLSGLAVAQHFAGGKIAHLNVLGDPQNELVILDRFFIWSYIL